MESLCAEGHSFSTVITFTPRQITAFMELAAKRKTHEAAAQLSLNALAAQGEGKTINKRIKELLR